MKSKRKPEEKSAADEVPGYIVTFSDMVTLLLTFFVMLLSLAEVQDPELFNKGRDSFVESLRHCGLGILMGNTITPGFKHKKEHYLTDRDDPSADRTIDAEREYRQRVFKRIRQKMTTMESQIKANQIDFAAVDVSFAMGSAVLDTQSKMALQQFAVNLQSGYISGVNSLYVLGLDKDSPTTKQQLLLSARRAQVVSNYLKAQLRNSSANTDGWTIYAWGAGKGRNWAGQDMLPSGQSDIFIAFLK
jgi:outer membrane protein OmpA-like peptidoglycan-associated protein